MSPSSSSSGVGVVSGVVTLGVSVSGVIGGGDAVVGTLGVTCVGVVVGSVTLCVVVVVVVVVVLVVVDIVIGVRAVPVSVGSDWGFSRVLEIILNPFCQRWLKILFFGALLRTNKLECLPHSLV
jgi:hypothetical protein